MNVDDDDGRPAGILHGKVVLVTGASRGLGAATARRCATEGARVAVNYCRSGDAAGVLVDEIRARGGTALAVQADVRDPDEAREMVAKVTASLGLPDVVVLNADGGGFRPGGFDSLAPGDYVARASDELRMALSPVKAVAPGMIARKRGCILAVSSALARVPVTGFSLLAVSKAALEALVRALAVELGPEGIRVNAVEASLMVTVGSEVVSIEQREWVRRAVPLGRVARTDDVAGVIALLASDAAGFVNGATIPVNGGQVLY